MTKTETKETAQTVSTKDWYAWLNLMPPKPDDFHVIGEVLVPNPGVKPELTVKEPQGFNPQVLILELHLVQQPGIWPQHLTWAQARYDRVLSPKAPKYTDVQILSGGDSISTIKVETVQ